MAACGNAILVQCKQGAHEQLWHQLEKNHTLLPICVDLKPPDRVDLIPPQFALTLCRPI